MSSSSSNDSKLIFTAVGAALAGAAMGVAAMKLAENKNRSSAGTDHHHSSSNPDYGERRSTLIFEDLGSSERRPAGVVGSDAIIFPHNHEERMRRKIAARAQIEEDNVMPRNSVTVRVPATSANLGPGCKLPFKKIVNSGEYCFSGGQFIGNERIQNLTQPSAILLRRHNWNGS